MISDDVGFLLIFIVLPTVLIVSGFWLVLFVRRDARTHPTMRVNLTSEQADAVATFSVSSVDDAPQPLGVRLQALEAAEGVIEAPVAVQSIARFPPDWTIPSALDELTFPVEQDDPSDQLSPIVADLLYSDVPPPVPTVSDYRLIELLDEDDRETMRDVIALDDEASLSREELIGATEDIEPPDQFLEYLGVVVPPDVDPPGGDESEPSSPLEAPAQDESDQASEANASGDTAQLPEPSELDDAVQEDRGGDDAETESRRRRHPDARLLPSTRHVRQRGRSSGKRVPKIFSRSTARDEDAVEGEDRG
jgi:hypothetical protein